MSIFKPAPAGYEPGLFTIDMKELAKACGFTHSGLQERLQRLGLQQITSEASRLAHVRAFDKADGSLLNAAMTEEDLINATRSFLK